MIASFLVAAVLAGAPAPEAVSGPPPASDRAQRPVGSNPAGLDLRISLKLENTTVVDVLEKLADLVDTPRSWAMTMGVVQTAPATACTVSLTPRRLQQLVVAPGASFNWTNTAIASGAVVQSGTAVADADGLLTIDGLALSLITR